MKVFVSYNNRDAEVAARIVDGLAASLTNFDPYSKNGLSRKPR